MNKVLLLMPAVCGLLFTAPCFAQSENVPPTAQAAPEPTIGYQGMLPYVQENAEIRKEAARKYGKRKKKTSKTKKPRA